MTRCGRRGVPIGTSNDCRGSSLAPQRVSGRMSTSDRLNCARNSDLHLRDAARLG